MGKNKLLNTKNLAVLGMLVAVSVVLSRFCVVYITTSIRINFGNIPIFLAGIFFGPIAGGLTGAVSDIIGSCFLSPLGYYPPLTVGPVIIGVIAGILRRFVAVPENDDKSPAKSGMKFQALQYLRACTVTLTANVVASMTWTTLCLHRLYGTPVMALLTVRVPLYIAISLLEALAICAVLASGYFNSMIYRKEVKHS